MSGADCMPSRGPVQSHTHSQEHARPGTARILLVDDLDVNLVALSGLLNADGVELFHALSGQDALELLLVHDFALAIIDVQMPLMNGFELATLMRGTERTRQIPIIFITAGAQNQQHRFKGYESGAVDFLYKPIEADILRYKAAVFLELYRSRQEVARQRDELLRSEQNLAAELKAARCLQELSTHLIQSGRPDTLYSQILNTVREILSPDYAGLHMVNGLMGEGEPAAPSELRLLAHVGFSPQAAAFWERVDDSSPIPCSVALRTGRRVMVPDVLECEFIAGTPAEQKCVQIGIRAMQSTPLCSRSGQLLGMISTAWRKPHEPRDCELRALDVIARQAADLIDRTNAVLALRQTTERLRFMAESMPQKIFTARPDGEVDYCNKKMAEFTGTSFAELHGWNWKQCVHPEDLEENLRLWRHSIATGETFEFEHRLRRHDGVYRWHLTRAHAMRDESGKITMWIGSNTEIHSQKETEADLRHLNDDLNHFAFAASHDLQEPLRMISCYSELLIRSYGASREPAAEMYTRYIREGTSRMRDLLHDLLSYTQVTQERPIGSETSDLNQAFRLAVQNLKPAIEGSGAVVLSDPLPEVSGHEIHFVQLFQNLVSNALKYRGTAPPRIVVTVEQRNQEWRFAVTDNGTGIAPEYHRLIFGVFKRLHGKEISGTGIGLSICQRVVERYGGRIWVESDAGQGATFRFTLPVML